MYFFEFFPSKRVLVLLLIFIGLSLAMMSQHLDSSGIESKADGEYGLRFKRSLKKFHVLAAGTAPCTKPGRFLNKNIKNGRWYWFCYFDESGNLAWMKMRCPNKRLFDPTTQKCEVSLTATTSVASSSTSLSPSSTSSTSLSPSSTTNPTPVSEATTPTTTAPTTLSTNAPIVTTAGSTTTRP